MFDAIFTLDSLTLKNYLTEDFSVFHNQFRSSRSILLNLIDQFENTSKLAFTMPESLKSDKQLYGIKNNRFVPIDGDMEADLLMILGVDAENPSHSIEDLNLQYDIYRSLSDKIGRFSNPLDSKAKINKRNLYNIIDNSFLPLKYPFSTWDDINSLIDEHSSVVLKKVSGANGDQVYLLNNSNFNSIKTKLIDDPLSNYILQEPLDIIAEKRFIFYGNELIISRTIADRLSPWEERGEVSSDSKNPDWFLYTADKKDVNRAREYSKLCNLDYSAVDFVEVSSGKQYLMEINGIHPGMMSTNGSKPGYLYDLGPRFVKFIKEELLKK